MKSIQYILTSTLLAFSLNAFATDMGTPDEAKAMSEKAAEHVNKAAKQEDAFADFSKEGGDFLAKDLYVFCMDLEGVMLSHPKKPQLVGKNLLDFNKHGDLLFQDMIKVAKGEEGKGWVDYKWPYPGTEEVREKTSYVIKNEKGFFCGVGAYKAKEEAAAAAKPAAEAAPAAEKAAPPAK